MRAHVAGASNVNSGGTPVSMRDDFIASLIAKNIDAARNNGGSPTAYKVVKVFFSIFKQDSEEMDYDRPYLRRVNSSWIRSAF